MPCSGREAHEQEAGDVSTNQDELLAGLELAWGLIANVNGGDWSEQNAVWITAAKRWRDRYNGVWAKSVMDEVEQAQPSTGETKP